MTFSNHEKGLLPILGLMLILIVSGCTATGQNYSQQQAAPDIDAAQHQTVDWRQAPPPPETKDLIAVAGFENKSTYSAERILLCDHFITGTITRFNISTHAKSSALSKEKIIDTSVRVDLLLQNAMTGEYIAAGRGEHTIRQTYSPGQVGSWDSSVGDDDALDIAIEKALFELIVTYRQAQYCVYFAESLCVAA